MSHATLALRTSQQTALTPRLQQSVRLLQLSSAEFAQELEQALSTNPFLEIAAGDGERTSEDDGSGPAQDGAAQLGTGAIDGSSGDASTQEATVVRIDEGDDPVFDSHHDPFANLGLFGDGSRDDDTTSDVGSWADERPTLHAHLHEELSGYRLAERDRALAAMVVEALDDDGYLRQELSEVVERFAFEPPVGDVELDAALALVQRIGPPGIAARNVSECLALQLENLLVPERGRRLYDADIVSRALVIVREHLPLLAARNTATLRDRLCCTADDVNAAAELIRHLDPRPGSAYGGEVARPVVPDVIVRRGKTGWQADINPAVIPRVALNRVYAALFHDSRGGDRAPLGQQLQEARWLLRNAAQRFVTIRRVARIIVAEQTAFLTYGDIAIRPLLLREVADQLDLHESTVSRAISNKFIATPRGVFAFKHFFSRKLATASGGSCSAASIRAAMRELIDDENRKEPLSDVAIAKRLTDEGLCVARRTVTKYRGLMGIPPVDLRRDEH